MKKLLFFLLLVTGFALAENNEGFTYQNEIINPACVAMFNTSMADRPYIRAINMNVCQHSNAAYQNTLHTPDGWHYFYTNDKNDQDGSYSYKVIGKTTNGIYVLNTSSSGGGTMVAHDLLLLRLDKSKQYTYNGSSELSVTDIVEMKLIGYIIGGDRCVGGFAKAEVVDNQIKISQYNGDNVVDCEKIKNYSIDLSKL